MKKPPAFVAMCVLGILLGAFSFCCGTYSVGATLLQARTLSQPAEPGVDIPGLGNIQQSTRRMQEQMQELAPFTIVLAGLGLLYGILLTAVASLSLAMQRAALRVFPLVLVVGIGWALVQAVVSTFLSYRSAQIVSEMMQGIGPNGGMGSIASASMAWGMCWILAITGAKVLYSGGSFFYLRSDEARTFLGPSGAPAESTNEFTPRGD